MKKYIFIFLSTVFFGPLSFAQQKETTEVKSSEEGALRRADLITVKASLEDILVRRYTQELSSIVEYDQFYIGANFDLQRIENKRGSSEGNSSYNDLDLTYLNADELFESYAFVDGANSNPLENYTIKSIEVNVGLKPVLGEKAKTLVKDWLSKRVKQEFGDIGSVNVQYIQNQETSSGFLIRWLKDLQGLVGSLVLAIAILLGVVLWKLLSGTKQEESATPASSVNIQSESHIKGLDQENTRRSNGNQQDIIVRIQDVSTKIKDLTESCTGELDELVEEWCSKGEQGLYRLASFAEIATPLIGTLSIPQEHKKRMGDIFSEMNQLELEKKLDLLTKTYWDLVASLNLGVETIREPFSFVYNSNLEAFNKALVESDIESQTVFTLYMPDKVRKNYMGDLTDEKRIEFLKSAAHLSSISEDNLKSIENHYAPYFEDATDESSVSMSLTFTKLVESLTWADACHSLPQVEGPVATKYKRNNAHVAYLKEWSQEDFRIVCRSATSEALLAYIVTLPEMKDKVLELVSPRTQSILEDDLDQAASWDERKIEEHLGDLNRKIESLVEQGTIDLNKTFENESKDETKPNIKIVA